MEYLLEILTWIWTKIGKYVEALLSHHGHLAAALALTGAIACVYMWVSQVETILSFSAQAMGHESEPIAQQFGTLESLVLSGFEKPALNEQLTEHAQEILDGIDHKLAKVGPANGASLARHLRLASPDAGPTGPLLLRRQYLENTSASHAEAAEQQSSANIFLFVPAVLLPTSSGSGGGISQNMLGEILDRAPQLKTDIAASFQLGAYLDELTKERFGAWNQPLQAYFITRTGVFAGVMGAMHSTTRRSPTRVYFAERPYFWTTVELRSKEGPTKGFHVTYPYLDLVGKGVIFTVCRAVRSDAVSDAVVCMDFRFDNAVERLKHRLRPFQLAEPAYVSCTVNAKGDVENCERRSGDQNYNESVNIVNASVRKLGRTGNLDEMTGGVFRLEDDGSYKPALWRRWLAWALKYLDIDIAGITNRPLHFTVPVGRTEENRQDFLVYLIDVDAPQWSLLGYGVGFAFSLVLLGLSLYYTHQARVLALKFVENLERVMSISPVPFMHLNEGTYIVGSNPSFRRLSGYSAEELQKRTFSSVLSTRSGLRYSKVAEFRRQFLMTNPYEVELICADGQKKRLVVHGAPLHMPPGKEFHIKAKNSFALPHTFGILVPPPEMVGKYVDLSVGDDLFGEALRADLKQFSDGGVNREAESPG
jgi:PAS domain S-box-containing protein